MNLFKIFKSHDNSEIYNKSPIKEISSWRNVEINIVDKKNNDIIFEYSYGNFKKIENGIETMSAIGYKYNDFIQQVLLQYPWENNKYFEMIEK